jgi:transcriptional regulator with XRE-family HTH domain
MELGDRIRTLRKSQNISIETLSKRTGLSKGLISQTERDITGPTVTSLWKICKALNVKINYFFDELEEYNPIVRKGERKKIQFKHANRTYELLCPDLKKAIEMLWIEIEPGECSTEELISHEGEECGIVIKGTLTVMSEEKEYNLNEGDSIYLDSTTPHRYKNIGNETSVSVWAMVPQSF